MRILVINPNTTASMTHKIAAAARAAASPGVEIVAINPDNGPPSIEGYYDEVFSILGVIEEMRRAGEVDATVIACFDDTGLEAARCVSPNPVIGIGEAGFHMASLIADRFGVVTTLSRSVAPIEHNLVRYGLASRCAGVRACEVAVLELEDASSNARQLILAEARKSLIEDKAEAIVLGCAGMTELAGDLARELGAPVLDGVACAVALAESAARIALRTSKVNTYQAPIAKKYAGSLAHFSPGFAP
jgi:allantoin racemase